MKFNVVAPLVAFAIISGLFACRKDIPTVPPQHYARITDTIKPTDTTATDSDSTKNAADSTKNAIDSVKNAGDSAVNAGDSVNNIIETTPAVHSAVYMNVSGNVAGFWQSLPAHYEKTTKSYPLILFMHGVGELGTNLGRMNCCGLPRHLQNKSFPPDFQANGKHYSFIVMSPQFKWRPSPAEVQATIDFAKRRFRVDPKRIYVAGMSLGGGAAWDYAAAYGQNAAAVVPVCGGTKPTTTLARNVASKYLPVWTIHSSGDAVVPVVWAKEWVDWIRKDNPSMAGSTKLTVWNSINHNSTWAKAFDPNTRVDGKNIYEWMLQYERR